MAQHFGVLSRMNMNARALTLALALAGGATAALLLASCASTSSSSSQTADSRSAQRTANVDPAAQLRQGMLPDQVRSLLGEPRETRPFPSEEGTAEVWIYERKDVAVRPTAATTQEVPYVDPLTGVMRTVQEPVYSQESVSVTRELQLLWFDGKLESWKSDERVDRHFN